MSGLVTYAVETAGAPDSDRGSLSVTYGWAHLHAFTRLLASEEGIDLSRMRDYGGNTPWTSAITPLSPLFDMDSFENGRLSADRCKEMRSRLSEVCELWSRGAFAGEAEDETRADQSRAVTKLLAVIDTCIATGRALVLR